MALLAIPEDEKPWGQTKGGCHNGPRDIPSTRQNLVESLWPGAAIAHMNQPVSMDLVSEQETVQRNW